MNDTLSMDQVFINKLTEIVHANLANENFCIDDLAREAGMSRSKIHRKLQTLIHKSVSQFIREIRLQRAMEMLQQNLGTASEIAFSTGFGSPTYFNKCFHDYYGYPPGEVKKREFLNSETGLNSLEPKFSESGKRLNNQERIIIFRKPKRISIVIGTTILIISIALILFFDLLNLFPRDNFENIIDKDGRIPIAIMPFENSTNDTTMDNFQRWIMDGLITSLSDHSEYFQVRQKQSVDIFLQGNEISNYASITPSVGRSISKKLDANIFMIGSIRQGAAKIRLNAQLINSKTGRILKSFPIDGKAEDIIDLSDSLSTMVTNFLIISVMKKELLKEYQNIASTTSFVAYDHFIKGYEAFYKKMDFQTASEYLIKAIDADSNFVQAYILLTWSYFNQGMIGEAKEWCLRLYEKTDHMNNLIEEYGTKEIYALYFQDPNERIKHLRCLLAIDDQNPIFHDNLGEAYYDLGQYDAALLSYEKELEIYKQWGLKPRWIATHYKLGDLYYQMGMYKEARKLYRKAEKDFPEMNPNIVLISRQAILALIEGRKKAANEYIKKFKNILKDDPMADFRIMNGMANIYEKAGILDTADINYRKALSLRKTYYWLYRYASFLINNDIDIYKGVELIEEALQLEPNNYSAIHTKAWGLYKQGNFSEAQKFINQSDSLKPIYNYRINLHKQEIEKALARQQNI